MEFIWPQFAVGRLAGLIESLLKHKINQPAFIGSFRGKGVQTGWNLERSTTSTVNLWVEARNGEAHRMHLPGSEFKIKITF